MPNRFHFDGFCPKNVAQIDERNKTVMAGTKPRTQAIANEQAVYTPENRSHHMETCQGELEATPRATVAIQPKVFFKLALWDHIAGS